MRARPTGPALPVTDDARDPLASASGALRASWRAVARWFDAAATTHPAEDATRDRVDWTRILPFVGMHVACLAVFWVGASAFAVGAAALLYALRMFAITGFYHRYFSHRTFKTSRVAQFVFAVLGASAVQRGPIWWAAHHRHHHAHSDQAGDVHSPGRRGFLWSHLGWFLSRRHFAPDLGRVRDLLRFPELRWLDRFDIVVPVLMATGLLLTGHWLEEHRPALGVTGAQLLVWGFFVSTVACYHGTYTINSLCHVWGRQRYATGDQSRNNLFLALLTLGEGWHNNHHRYPMSARQGFYWWEIDVTYYLLRLLSAVGIVWDLKPVPREVREAHTAVAS